MRINYKLTAPLSHIGETSSTGSIFQTILTSDGRLPVVTGNSIRGTLRDCGAKHLLKSIGMSVDKTTFNVLFSGGNLSGAAKHDIARAIAVREHFPLISVLGGGLGTMIMGGKTDCGFAYPVCIESCNITGVDSDVSWRSLIDEIEFTRTDDSKNDKNSAFITNVDAEKAKGEASTQMRYSVEYLAAGTELMQNIYFYDNVTDVELGAFLTCVAEWFKHPKLGGMGNKGFGTFTAESFDDDGNALIKTVENGVEISETAQNLIDAYADIEKNSAGFLELLGGKSNGKA